MNKKPYLTVASGIVGILAREGIVPTHSQKTMNCISLIETELAEYFANKEFKALDLQFGTKEYKTQFRKIYRKHGIKV